MDSEIIPIEAGISERAISFTKGCYVGQEVIVRIMHRGEGRVAKRLVGLALNKGTDSYKVPEMLPARGATLWHDDKAVGRLTSVTWSPKLSQVVGLGYLPRLLTETGTKVMVEIDGRIRSQLGIGDVEAEVEVADTEAEVEEVLDAVDE